MTSTLANYWAAKGWNVTIITLSSKQEDYYKLNAKIQRVSLLLEGESESLLIGIIQNIRRVMALRRELLQAKPNIALAMMEKANVLLAIASWRLTSIGLIGSERTYPPQHPIGVMWEQLRKYSYGSLHAVVAQTRKGSEWIRSNTNVRRVITIPNHVVLPLPIQNPIVDVSSICSPERKIILAVGRLSSEKQFGILVDCFASLASEFGDWDLAILGEGPLRVALENKINQANLDGRVFLPGRVGNVGDWYARADLYVMCSRYEGFPNALIEAMAHGLAAISFDCDTGPREIIRHGIDGLLVPPGDVGALTEAMKLLMSDHELRHQFATEAASVRERFSFEEVAENWETLFNETCVL